MVSLQASTPDSIALNQTYGFIYLKFRLIQTKAPAAERAERAQRGHFRHIVPSLINKSNFCFFQKPRVINALRVLLEIFMQESMQSDCIFCVFFEKMATHSATSSSSPLLFTFFQILHVFLLVRFIFFTFFQFSLHFRCYFFGFSHDFTVRSHHFMIFV